MMVQAQEKIERLPQTRFRVAALYRIISKLAGMALTEGFPGKSSDKDLFLARDYFLQCDKIVSHIMEDRDNE